MHNARIPFAYGIPSGTDGLHKTRYPLMLIQAVMYSCCLLQKQHSNAYRQRPLETLCALAQT